MRFPIEHEIGPLQVGAISQYDGMTNVEMFAALLKSQWFHLLNDEMADKIARQAETWFKPEAVD